MDILVERIEKEGKVKEPDSVKVDGFLNHQLDVRFLNEIGKEFARRFQKALKIDKILTIEASGIAIASIASQYFNFVPVVFAKKLPMDTPSDDSFFESKALSFTKKLESKIRVSKKFLIKDERILILDDFLAMGNAALSLMSLVEAAGAKLEGVGIVIEKGFQDGGKILRGMGVFLESLVIVEKIENEKIY